jgi:hypothetical protein
VSAHGADLLRLAAKEVRETSPTGTYGDPCGECGMRGAFLDALADWFEADAEALDDFENVSGAAFEAARVLLGDES